MTKAAKTRKRVRGRPLTKTGNRVLWVWAAVEARRLPPLKGTRRAPLSVSAACSAIAREGGLVIAPTPGGIGDIPASGDRRGTIKNEYRKAVASMKDRSLPDPNCITDAETLRDYYKRGKSALRDMLEPDADAWRTLSQGIAKKRLVRNKPDFLTN